VVALIPREQPHCCACWSTTQRVTGSVLSGKKQGQPLLSERKKVSGRVPPKANPPLRKPSGPDPLRSRRAAITSSEGACLPPLHKILTPLLRRFTEAPSQPKVIATRKMDGPKKPKPNSTTAPKPAAGKTNKKAAASVKTAAPKHRTPQLVVPLKLLPPHSRISLISSITSPSKRVWS